MRYATIIHTAVTSTARRRPSHSGRNPASSTEIRFPTDWGHEASLKKIVEGVCYNNAARYFGL